MALINCSECGRQVSDKAASCPHCGCPVINSGEVGNTIPETNITTKKKRARFRTAIIVFIILVVLATVCTGTYIATNQLSDEEQNQVQLVYDKIQSIGNISYSSGTKIEQAESALAQLDEKCQRYVENRDDLLAARRQYDTLVSDKVKKSIDDLGTIYLNSKSEEKIENARTAYNELTDNQKVLVSNYELLEQAEEELNTLQIEHCKKAIDSIGEVGLDSKNDIEKAKEIYQNLSKEQQSQIDNYELLQQAESEYSEISISKCVELINMIGEVTLDSGNVIRSAEAAYQRLSVSDQNDLANYYSILSDAREKFDALKEAKEKEERKSEVRSTIRVTKVRCSKPNTVGGVDVYINFTNKSAKTIKYITFQVVPYNAVGDMVECEIWDRSYANLKGTGPYAKGQGLGDERYWDTVWYNSTIAEIKLTSIKIEYTDGSTAQLTEADMDYVIY